MMAKVSEYDVLVIGGGPAGYVGCIRAAQLGLSAACVERDRLGGVCLNWGCIPTKALLAGAEFYRRLTHDAEAWGVHAKKVSYDWSAVIARSRGVASNLNKGVAGLLKKNKVAHYEGHARIARAPAGRGGYGDVEVLGADGKVTQKVRAKHIIIATGAAPRALPGVAFDGERVISSKEAMTLAEQPKRLVIVGAGAIGMEFAYFFNAYGTEVTVVEMLDRLVPNEDADVSKAVAKAFRKQKIDCRTATKTVSVTKSGAGVEVTLAPVDAPGRTETVAADKVLVGIGVRGLFDGLFGDAVKVEVERDHIKVDRGTYETSAPGVYAVGDVIGPPWLAHVASEEAVVCVERIAGHAAQSIDYGAIPGCTYCQPQIASVGLTEGALVEKDLAKGRDYSVGMFPFQASGKAQAVGHTEGFVKLIAGLPHGEILGAHMVGDSVTEMIAEMGLAMRLEATLDEVVATMHAHPTLSEAVHEAALGASGRMLHF